MRLELIKNCKTNVENGFAKGFARDSRTKPRTDKTAIEQNHECKNWKRYQVDS